MKTLEELYNEMLTSDDLKAELAGVDGIEAVVDFLHRHGCDATWDEYQAFMLKQRDSREMTDEELEQVAGGSVGTIITSALMFWSCAACSIAIEAGTDDDCIESMWG